MVVAFLLLFSAVLLVLRSTTESDDVWAVCLRVLAGVAVFTVVVGDHGLPLCLVLLGIALWLPSAERAERELINRPSPGASPSGQERRR
ncbi:MAG: hypothetical protein ACK46L_14810 [Synechococcaceae cyanobacterium]|jgi:hypothetical protein